jgi:hypothetical protein
MNYYFQLFVLLWEISVSNGFPMPQIVAKYGIDVAIRLAVQYVTISTGRVTDSVPYTAPEVIFAPILGLQTSVRFISCVSNSIERGARIGMVASLLVSSMLSIAIGDPSVSGAMGGLIHCQISLM